jgi:hypothetical protein
MSAKLNPVSAKVLIHVFSQTFFWNHYNEATFKRKIIRNNFKIKK